MKTQALPTYRPLLVVLIINLIIAPFLTGLIGSLIAALMFFVAIVVVIRSLELPMFFFKFYLLIAFIAFILEILGSNGWLLSTGPFFLFIAQGIYAAYLGISIILIFRSIFTASRVTIDTIQGGICIYLMVGIIWALFYGMTSTIDPNAFSPPFQMTDGYTHILYFSFTTLTTLGYGDILPVSELAQVLTNSEAIAGQLYPSIFMGLLVGSYLSHNRDKA